MVPNEDHGTRSVNLKRIARASMKYIPIVLLLAIILDGTVSAEPLYDTPVYNSETKSYFELARAVARGGGGDDRNWESARRSASNRQFKGVRGRLAVVKSRQVNDFLRDTFQPNHRAWIGLRYWCRFRVLQWVTGDRLEPGDYQNWGPVWNQTIDPNKRSQCFGDKDSYLPVHYWQVHRGFRWNAISMGKAHRSMFIEYPTGKE
jgi:hypothetical protein